MAPNTTAPTARPTIHFSRTVGLTNAIAKGSSITIGLTIMSLAGPLLHQTGALTPQAYLAAMVVFLPLLLTYAERAAITPGGGGVYALVRASGSTLRTYAAGWLLLGGYLALVALLGWSAALHLNVSLDRLLGLTGDMRLLAPLMVILVALNDLIGTRGRWRLRSVLVYAGIGTLLVIIARTWLLPPLPPAPSLATDETNPIPLIALLAVGLWGIQFVLDSRDEMRAPERNILPALLIPAGLGGLIGAAAISAAQMLGAADATPLATLAIHANFTGESLLEAVYVTLSLLVCLVALDRALTTMLHLAGALARDGFLPERLLKIAPRLGTPLVALRLVAIVCALAAALVPTLLLAGLAALAFLWTSGLLMAYDMLSFESTLPPKRLLRLPLHPLLPGISTVICIFLPLALPSQVLLLGTAWALLGVGYYLGYARQQGFQVRRRAAVVMSEAAANPRGQVYTVLVCTANPETASALIRTGALLARARQGRMLVLRIAVFPDQVPLHLRRQLAQEQWDDLYLLALLAGAEDVPREVLVRLAQSPIDGILSTAQEEKVNLVLLGWEGAQSSEHVDLDPLLDPIVRTAACDVVVARGCLPSRLGSILVPTAGSPNTLAAMRLAQQLVGTDGKIVALNLVQEVYSPETMPRSEKRLREMIGRLGEPAIELRMLPTDDIRAGIVRETTSFDLLLLGASRGGALDQAIFGGLPVEVARASPRPALLVKHYEGARRFWARRAWEIISAPFPSLGASEREEVYQQMRNAARPGPDFFILIGLAAMIATLGLLQGSPAVIIGAMLVAPLMSPILSLAMSLVQGNPYLLRLDAVATLMGTVLAISISIAVTLAAPTSMTTGEILARAQPNLLDLLVALASGAAGGYAAGRKEVATALPGVAIAAALVPPLCVVGYGMATAQLDISGGALLLFATNLVAIVFAAAFIFLLLGFRPTQARLRLMVRLSFLLAILALLLISIPLTIFSVNSVGQRARQNQVEEVLRAEVASTTTYLHSVAIERQENRLLVHAVIYASDAFTDAQLAYLQQQLSSAMGQPVTLRATVLQALRLPTTGQPDAPPTPAAGGE